MWSCSSRGIVRSPVCPAEAQRWSTLAGDDAFDHLAPAEAAHHYRAALDLAIALRSARRRTRGSARAARRGPAPAGDAAALDTLEQGAQLARRSGAHDALIKAVFAADRGFMRFDEHAPGISTTVEAAVAVADRGRHRDVLPAARAARAGLVAHRRADRRVALAHEAFELADAITTRAARARVAPAVLYGSVGARERRAPVADRGDSDLGGGGFRRSPARVQRPSTRPTTLRSNRPTMLRPLAASAKAPVDGAQALGEPRLRWLAGLIDTFDATMAGRLTEAEAMAAATLELGMQIGAPDAFSLFAGQFFVIGTFAGRHDELFPLVEQAATENPWHSCRSCWPTGSSATAVGREETRARSCARGWRTASRRSVDFFWSTAVIGYAIIAIELDDTEAAAQLLPLIEPLAADVSFNGADESGADRRLRREARIAAGLARRGRGQPARRARHRHRVRLDLPPRHNALRARAGAASPVRRARRRRPLPGSRRHPTCAGRAASGPGSPDRRARGEDSQA